MIRIERQNALISFFDVVIRSYAHTLFSDKLIPSFIFLAATFYDPFIGFMGLLGNIAANGFASLMHTDKNYIHAGVFGINGILVGISVGLYVPDVTEALVVLLITIGLVTLVTISLLSALTRKRQFPVLSIPFIITTWIMLFTLKSIHGTMPHATFHAGFIADAVNQYAGEILPTWLSSYITAFGTTLFQPNIYSGLLVAIGVLLTSRISFLAGTLGGLLGIILYSLIGGDAGNTQQFSSSLNYIIVAIGLCGFFVAPNVPGMLYAMCGVAVTVFLANGLNAVLSPFELPAIVAPFNIAILVMLSPLNSQILYTARAGLYLVPLAVVSTPEKNRKWYLENHGQRGKVHFRLPFYGKWFVYQGEFGLHTHKGTQAYAYDFIVVDNETKQFRDFGMTLDDYYTFGLPVLAPADGKIIAVVNHIKDNLPGVVNELSNWGNFVIIEHSEIEFTEISHFKEGSITVSVGESVKCGQVLGQCGNSGFSPVPHLHIQRQKGPFLAAETVSIRFSNVSIEHNGESRVQVIGSLPQGAVVENV